jgi:hypothetical protein
LLQEGHCTLQQLVHQLKLLLLLLLVTRSANNHFMCLQLLMLLSKLQLQLLVLPVHLLSNQLYAHHLLPVLLLVMLLLV